MEDLVCRDEAIHLPLVPLLPDLGRFMRRVEELEPHVVERPRRHTGIGLRVARVPVDRQAATGQQPLHVGTVFGWEVERSQVVVEGAVFHHDQDKMLDLFDPHGGSECWRSIFVG